MPRFSRVGGDTSPGPDRVFAPIRNESAPIQLAQCWFPELAIYNVKILIYIFQIKYTEAILSNSTRKLLRFEITEVPIAVSEKNYCVIYYNFRHTFVPCDSDVTPTSVLGGVVGVGRLDGER